MKLTYFDVHGGRAEPIRLAFSIGNIAFEDHRFGFAEFQEIKQQTPLGQVPTLTMQGKQITQCNAILRYAGKLANLYPNDPLDALHCDEIIDAMEDATHKIVATFGLTGDKLKDARMHLVNGPLKSQLTWLESKISNANDYLIADTFSIADLKVMVFLKWLLSGTLDHIPASVVSEKLLKYVDKISHHPGVMAYYENV